MLVTDLLTGDDELTTSSINCPSCGFEATMFDQFCRACGKARTARIKTGIKGNTQASLATTVGLIPPVSYATAKFTQRELCRHFSNELVKTLTPRVSRRRCRILRENRFLSGLMFAMIVLPIWLLIISLSPFDAFLAAKSAVSTE